MPSSFAEAAASRNSSKERVRMKRYLITICFFDEQLANRVANAMVYAVELCGGGSKPEPF